MIDVEQRVTRAMELFTSGYNCSQSVVLAYDDLLAIDPRQLATIAAPFGGGMGRLREVCGAVSGMFMVSSYICSAGDPTNLEAKRVAYKNVQSLAASFTELNGSIICRELLGLSVKKQEPTPDARTEEYYKKRPCKELVAMAARLVGEMINDADRNTTR